MKRLFCLLLLGGLGPCLPSMANNGHVPATATSVADVAENIAENQLGPQLTLIIIDGETGFPITAQVRVIDMLKKKFLYSGLLKDTLKVNLEAGGDYRVISKADNHLFNEQELNLAEHKFGSHVNIVLPLAPIKRGAKLELREVFFDVNSADVKEESYPELKEVYDLLWEHPDLVIEISAHTDNQGSHDHNMELSEKRAQAVVDFLKSKGVPGRMLVAKGYGETAPLVANDTPENRQKNRRVEFLVLDKK